VTHCVSPNPPSIDLQSAARQDAINAAKEAAAALKLTQLPKMPDFAKQQSTLFKQFDSVLSAIKAQAAQAANFRALSRV
jgi:hypothetical protein